jgi:hypothetical protein
MKRIKYQDRIVCFLDILGFKNHIDRTITQNGKDNPDKVGNIINAINAIRFYTDIDKLKIDKSKKVSQFSDSVVDIVFSK